MYVNSVKLSGKVPLKEGIRISAVQGECNSKSKQAPVMRKSIKSYSAAQPGGIHCPSSLRLSKWVEETESSVTSNTAGEVSQE